MRHSLRSNLTFHSLVLILVFCLSARQTLNAADPSNALSTAPRSLAEELFIRANDTNNALHARPLEERSADDYLRTLDLYSQVIRLNTDNHFSSESLTKRAELLREMADVRGDSALYQQAIEAFRQIVKSHPHSAAVGDALINIAEIYEENLQDLDGAISAYKELVDYFPSSVMAREARAVIARFEMQLANRSADVVAANHKVDAATIAGIAQLTNVRNFSSSDYARVVIDLSNNAEFTPTRIGNNKIAIKLQNALVASSLFGRRFIVGNDNLLKRITVYEGESANSGVQIELDVNEAAEFSTFKLSEPARIIVDIHAANATTKSQTIIATNEKPVVEDVTTPTAKTSEADATNKPVETAISAASKPVEATMNPQPPKIEGSNTIVKANKSTGRAPVMALPEITEPIVPHTAGDATNAKPNADAQAGAIAGAVDAKVASGVALKCVVIDAGHGGHDTGTISPNGLREKDLTLDVARRLKAYIKRNYPDIDVVMTRDGDYFVALEQRTAIANARHADLFISVHANSSPAKAASGVETFFVNPEKAKAQAEKQEVNNSAVEAKPAVAKAEDTITASVAVANRVAESRELARYIQSGLVRGIGAASPRSGANRGVKHAGFVVLMGAAMPSVLAEVSFLSNPKDEALLMTGQFRERIAASLFAGLNAYLKKNRGTDAK
ncbi:MAG: N-acetylmuramoyl-L-alanine amidase [Acidobacteriota bacterium]